MIYYERDEYIEAKKMLKDEYAVCYQKIATYIHLYYINGMEHEENCLLQIMDDFLSAQSEGRPVAFITGLDVRKFSDNMMKAELNRRNRKIIFVEQIATIPFVISMMIFMKILMVNDMKLKFEYFQKISFGGFELTFICLGMFMVFGRKILSKLFFEHIKVSKMVYIVFTFMFFVFIREILVALNQIIPINIPIPFAIFILLFLIPFYILIAIGNKERKEKRVIMLNLNILRISWNKWYALNVARNMIMIIQNVLIANTHTIVDIGLY
ncbi:MAG: DUF1048 domain-containing protein [Mobilitalea sp.]